MFINYLTPLIKDVGHHILFADDTSIIITANNPNTFQSSTEAILLKICDWFSANKLVLNCNKTNIIQFKSCPNSTSQISSTINNRSLLETTTTKFLGLQIDNVLNWKNRIKEITPKLNSACFAIRSMQEIVNINTLQTIYFAYFHSVMSFGIIFWGNSTDSNSIFLLQKE